MSRWYRCLVLGRSTLALARSTDASRDGRLEYGSIGDVRAVLASGGADALPLAYANVRYPTGEVIRSVAYFTTLPPATLAKLTSSLALTKAPAFNAGMRDACESRTGLRSTDPGVDVLVGQNTRVTNGVGRIEVHVVRATGAACIEITYPWG